MLPHYYVHSEVKITITEWCVPWIEKGGHWGFTLLLGKSSHGPPVYNIGGDGPVSSIEYNTFSGYYSCWIFYDNRKLSLATFEMCGSNTGHGLR